MWLEILVILLYIAAVKGLITGLRVLVSFYCDWKECKSLDVKLSFPQFLKFYELHPSKWYLYKNYIKRTDFSRFSWDDIKVGFKSWVDFAKYRRWYKKHEKEKELESKAKAEQEKTGRLLELIKADIKMVERQSENEISSAQETIEKVIGTGNDDVKDVKKDNTGKYSQSKIMRGDIVYAIVDCPNFINKSLIGAKYVPVRMVCKCVIKDIDYVTDAAGSVKRKLLLVDDNSWLYPFTGDDYGHRILLTQEEADKVLEDMMKAGECFVTEDGGFTCAGFTH